MTDVSVDTTPCDREPIHIPEAIQPHGMLLVVDCDSYTIRQVAGAVEARLGATAWRGRPLAELVGETLARSVAETPSGPAGAFLGPFVTTAGEPLDVTAHRSGTNFLLELEPGTSDPSPAYRVLTNLEVAAAAFQRADFVQALCDIAAVEFRKLTGFDRVMVYRFLDEDAGRVLSEDRRPDLHSFLNHYFPGSDIPRQARALYVRNLVRVIPTVTYEPAPLRPAAEPLDMSDCALRSVSPIHLQYLRNMGVGASASVSIVDGDVLWGLIACHHETPRGLAAEARSACRALAAGLMRQIKAKHEAAGYRERLRLGSFAGSAVRVLARDGALDEALPNHIDDIQRMLRGDGVAVVRGTELFLGGACPAASEVRGLADWLANRGGSPILATDRLPELYPPAASFQTIASGLLSLLLDADGPWIVLWFRGEHVQVVNWAGNPHQAATLGPHKELSPRASFEAWSEIVRGRARDWTTHEVAAAARLRTDIVEERQNWRVRELNRRLTETLRDKDLLLEQKDYLVGEVNHRVQNSLQLVSSFLTLQARTSENAELRTAIDEANRRLGAVALMHRRLYRGDQIDRVDVGRYLEDLCANATAAMGREWAEHITLDLAPITLPTDRVVPLGLILTELLINANKYAYAGGAGPIAIGLSDERGTLQLSVADKGIGRTSPRKGFGSRMIDALVAQLGGELLYADNAPGLRATLTAPIEGPKR